MGVHRSRYDALLKVSIPPPSTTSDLVTNFDCHETGSKSSAHDRQPVAYRPGIHKLTSQGASHPKLACPIRARELVAVDAKSDCSS